ncbi:sulfotransferase family 2 domain-containing protein [Nitrosomonas sp. Nm33]|uniref:sulfotransferase family 2 domain-containing protein n=1 Tax=Nitrosomonas sp. Nm33 TaxID=133724 RepID=UPI000B879503|nr:sulfotransferase family 2 domain-containing protein [Nitrosomonas sp. Nm33]
MRNIIFHYHFFKNAGTSVDALLKSNFPEQWVTREFTGGNHAINVSQVEDWIRQEPNAIAFSSHTAALPPPELKGIKILPVLFVRHPIDRIASAYSFERKQGGDSFGAVLARNTTLQGYIEVRLSLKHDRQCRNFHVSRLSQMFKGEDSDEIALALRALEVLPFVGIVDKFDQSMEEMAKWLSSYFLDFHATPMARNVTRDLSIPLNQRLDQIKTEIGEDCYTKLLEANAGDIAVYNASFQKRVVSDNCD